MIILMFIQVILMLWIIYISRKLYTYGDYDDLTFDKEDKVKIPIIVYLITLIVSLIPIAGIIFQIAFLIEFFVGLVQKDVYYKPGKIIQFLFKKV